MNLPLLFHDGEQRSKYGQQFNGSVRLFHRFSAVPERGRFRCELPSAANPSVNQILYVNICEFCYSVSEYYLRLIQCILFPQ